MQLRQNTAALEELGYQIFVIGPDKPERMRETIEKFNLKFQLLFDSEMVVSRGFGIAYNVIGKDDEYYLKLERASGETHYMLPSPATFILGTDGVVRFEYINPNFKMRIDPELLIAAAKASLKFEQLEKYQEPE